MFDYTEERWRSLKDVSADRKLTLQEMVADIQKFNDLHDNMTQWLAQKERMIGLLGPMATEPAMVATQLEQVKALKEEVVSQSAKYDSCVQSGLSILDKCDPDSKDAHDLNKNVEQVRTRATSSLCMNDRNNNDDNPNLRILL